MQQIIGFIVKNGVRLFFLLLLGISLWLTFNHHHYHRSKLINSSNRISGGIYSQTSSIGDYFSLKSDNERLYQENLELKRLLLNQQESTEDIPVNPPKDLNKDFVVYGSKIINNSFRKQKNFLTIKGGEKQGIKRDMGVINDKGIVGIIENTSPDFSTVLSVLNTNFQIVAKIKKNNQFGTLIWDGKSTGFVQLIDIPRIESIVKGDTVVTGFSSKAFPEDVPIGTIDRVLVDNTTNNSTLHIRLFNDMTSINYIYVIENLHKDEIKELEEKTESDE